MNFTKKDAIKFIVQSMKTDCTIAEIGLSIIDRLEGKTCSINLEEQILWLENRINQCSFDAHYYYECGDAYYSDLYSYYAERWELIRQILSVGIVCNNNNSSEQFV